MKTESDTWVNSETNINNHYDVSRTNSITKDKRTIVDGMPEFVNRIYPSLKTNFDRVQNYKRLRLEFLNKMNYELNIDFPQFYNEKIQWKKLFDRNPLLTLTADKYAVRFYLKELLGEEAANEILVPLYHVTDNPSDIPFDDLPDKFVIKPNHGSFLHMLVKDKSLVSREFIINECRKWLKVNFGFYNHEWAYRNIKRKIIIEKLLESKDCRLPLDYKLFCFHGKCKYIRVAGNRLDSDGGASFFDLEWNRLPVNMAGYNINNESFNKPANLIEIINLGEQLSENFDAVRVDFYICNEKIYFGEFTHYHASGLARFEPATFDFELGKLWQIKNDYCRKK